MMVLLVWSIYYGAVYRYYDVFYGILECFGNVILVFWCVPVSNYNIPRYTVPVQTANIWLYYHLKYVYFD